MLTWTGSLLCHIFILVCTVGYFNRLKNQSDPLSRQVAITIDSNSQVCQLIIHQSYVAFIHTTFIV